MSKTVDATSFMSPLQFYLRIILRVPKGTHEEIQARSLCSFRILTFQYITSIISMVIAILNYVSNESEYTNRVFMPYFATGHVYSQVDDDQHIYDGVMYSQFGNGKLASENKYKDCIYRTSLFNRADTEYIQGQGNTKSSKYAPYYTNATKTLDPACIVTLKELFYAMGDVCKVIKTNKFGLLFTAVLSFCIMHIFFFLWHYVESSNEERLAPYSIRKILYIVSSDEESYEKRLQAYQTASDQLNERSYVIHTAQIACSLYVITYTTSYLNNSDDLRILFNKATSNHPSCEPIKNYTILIDKITDEFNVMRILSCITLSIAIITIISVCLFKTPTHLIINEYKDEDVILDVIYNNNNNNNNNMIEEGKPDNVIHYRNNDMHKSHN